MSILNNDAAMKKLTDLRLLANREKLPFKLMRFIEDREYAREVIEGLSNTNDQEIMGLTMEVMVIFNLAGDTASMTAPLHVDASSNLTAESSLQSVAMAPSKRCYRGARS